MTENQAAARSAKAISLATMASRILGFLRDMLMARLFGATMFADAFLVAFRIPNLLRRLFGEGALNSSFVPVFIKARKESEEKAQVFTSNTFNILALTLLVVTALGILLADPLVRLMTFTFGTPQDNGKLELAIQLTRIMFPYVFFICLAALCMGFLNSCRHFFIPALSPVMLNLSMILLLGLGPLLMKGRNLDLHAWARGLSWAVVLGGLLQFAIHLPPMFRRGFKFRGILNFRDSGVHQVLALMGPAAIGMAVAQINILVDTMLAWLLGDGAVSALYYSNRLMQLPLAVFGIAIATAFMPTFSTHAAEGKVRELAESLTYALRTVMFITLPATAGLMVAGKPIIAFLFQRGKFDLVATEWTTQALLCYSLGLFFFAGTNITVKAFYSMEEAKAPVKIGSICMLTNVVLNLVLMRFMGHSGLALATSISGMLNLYLLLRALSALIGGFGQGGNLAAALRLTGATGIMAAAVWAVMALLRAQSLHPLLATPGSLVFFSITTGMAVYVAAAKVLGCTELKEFTQILFRRARRGAKSSVEGCSSSDSEVSNGAKGS